jgi:membrane-bound lytic murein transglycosylase D
MKKALKGLLFTLLFCQAASAKALTDTTANPLLANNSNAEYTIVPANVMFTNLLAAHKTNAQSHIETFAQNRRDYLIRMKTKGAKYFPKIEKIFAKYNVPKEFKVLIALESAYNGNAVSHCGATGYWQIMDEVAAQYGMQYVKTLTADEKKEKALREKTLTDSAKKALAKVKPTDDRKNFNKSTVVAAKLLRDLQRHFNDDILLIAASYNYGIGNVWKAMAKTGKAKPTFWDVKPYLPNETKNYVLNFITLNIIFNNYNNFLADNLIFNDIKVAQKVQLNGGE